MSDSAPSDLSAADKLKQRGNDAFRKRSFARAVALYSRAIDAGGDECVLLSNRAAAWLAAGDAPRAEADARACLALQSDSVPGLGRLGAALHAQGKHKDAAAAFRKAMALDPSSERLRASFKAAKRAAAATPAAEAEPAEAKGSAAPAPEQPAQPEAPAAAESPAAVVAPGEPEVPATERLKAAGNDAMRAGKHALAAQLYTEAISAEGGASNHILFSNRSAALAAVGTRDALQRAAGDAVRCTALRPDFAKGHLRRARAMLALGRAKDGEAAATDGLRLEPLNPALRQALEEARRGGGAMGKEAAAAWRQAAASAMRAAEARLAEAGEEDARAAREAVAEAGGSAADALAALTAELEAISENAVDARRKRPRQAEAAADTEPDPGHVSDDVGGATSSDESADGGGSGAGSDGDGGGVAARAERALGWAEAEPTPEEVAKAEEAAAAWVPGSGEEEVRRLSGPLARWTRLNPFDVLSLDENSPLELARSRFKRLSALVHPDKHGGAEAAREAFEAVKAAADALKSSERRQEVRRVVREGKRKAARLVRRERRQARAAKRPRVAETPEAAAAEAAANAKALAEAERREVLKAFASAEHRRLTLEASLRSEAREDAMESANEKAAAKREATADKAWEKERGGRIGSWRKFQDSAASAKGLKRDKFTAFGGKAAAAEGATGTAAFKATWR
ncbi:hypothetical protein FNF29_06347 [Cafeteria roenbergensis]|uniref:J domain-containing protein n=1 Tax=Cafeteria roenbergensis TaxID=33653 RepID=A0A5A8C776_CAFRO|nr:hypothetical protein FNF29_06347 [Cafeteria roenbergensis]|eukprot:KAA0148873.1 hypothetical protein FNF29_06347 [Cafeteria roenbergensis]